MHLHAIATLKVIIGTTHTDDPNGIHVDKDNNTIQANGKEPVANGKTIDQNGTGNSDGDKVVLTVDGTAKQSTETASGSGDNSEEVQVSRSETHKFRDRNCSFSFSWDYNHEIVLNVYYLFPGTISYMINLKSTCIT